jgi:hypothetical protein
MGGFIAGFAEGAANYGLSEIARKNALNDESELLARKLKMADDLEQRKEKRMVAERTIDKVGDSYVVRGLNQAGEVIFERVATAEEVRGINQSTEAHNLEVDKGEAYIEAQGGALEGHKAGAARDYAAARLADRTDPNLRAQGYGSTRDLDDWDAAKTNIGSILLALERQEQDGGEKVDTTAEEQEFMQIEALEDPAERKLKAKSLERRMRAKYGKSMELRSALEY